MDHETSGYITSAARVENRCEKCLTHIDLHDVNSIGDHTGLLSVEAKFCGRFKLQASLIQH